MLPGGKVEAMHWGFTHPTLTKPVFNAKCETAAKSPLFRGPFKKQRCLLPASGYYEKGHLITLPDQPLFAFAGLYRDGSECTMLTCGPNLFTEKLHHRMPCILHRRDYDRWLGGEGGPDLLAPYAGEMLATAVPSNPKKQTPPKPLPEGNAERQGELF